MPNANKSLICNIGSSADGSGAQLSQQFLIGLAKENGSSR